MNPPEARPPASAPAVDQQREQDYMTNRWLNQQKYYSNKASASKRQHMTFQLITAIGAVAVPILLNINFGQADSIKQITITAIALVVAVVTAIDRTLKPGDDWYNFRRASEALKTQGWLYKTRVDPYHRSNAFDVFVKNCEAIITAQNDIFAQQNQQTDQPVDTTTRPIRQTGDQSTVEG